MTIVQEAIYTALRINNDDRNTLNHTRWRARWVQHRRKLNEH